MVKLPGDQIARKSEKSNYIVDLREQIPLFEDFIHEVLKDAIEGMKNCKSTGLDEGKPVILKHLESGESTLWKFLNAIVEEEDNNGLRENYFNTSL